METEQAEMPLEPVVPEPVAVEQTPPETETVETPDDAGTHEEKPKGGFQRRIKELADDRNYWRELALQNSRQPPVETKPEPAPVSKKPALADFEYDEARYEEARSTWEDAQFDARYEQRLQREAQVKRQQTFVERLAAKPEVAQAIRDPHLPINAAMSAVIMDREDSVEILEWVVDHRDEARRIYNLAPHLAAAEIGAVGATLKLERESKTRPAVQKVSQAPPPPPSIDAVEPQIDKDPDSMETDEWLKWRNKQLRRKK